ncbi:hypothetical protein EYZ11_013190 [Aspergillus tanneri]|uniref:Uncharacterized protein n=1 Tax=Aspergillus tanneri TaxID=1220188 RepID=A0A4S3IYD0_9EURO|nr:hypothetical protein EYZ11_013190 [Aspergillus tanneri]
MFWPAWQKALTPKNIQSRFRSTGIWPFNPEAVLQRFLRPGDQWPTSSSSYLSSKSVVNGDNWRFIQQMIRAAVVNYYDESAKKLSSTIHQLATENALLRLENTGLRTALSNEKMKRQRAKPLVFQLQEPDSGGAIFYSPKNIQQARELHAAKDREVELAKASKEQYRLRRQQAKEEKQRLLQERKEKRAADKVLRERQAEEKKRQKEAERVDKEAARQLQNGFKTPKRGQKKQSTTNTGQNTIDITYIAPEESPEAFVPQSRRGRQIRLPHRFCNA